MKVKKNSFGLLLFTAGLSMCIGCGETVETFPPALSTQESIENSSRIETQINVQLEVQSETRSETQTETRSENPADPIETQSETRSETQPATDDQNGRLIVIDAGHQSKADTSREPIGLGAVETKIMGSPMGSICFSDSNGIKSCAEEVG